MFKVWGGSANVCKAGSLGSKVLVDSKYTRK